jgi:hypothetical protein
MHNKEIENELEAWLAFLSMDEQETIDEQRSQLDEKQSTIDLQKNQLDEKQLQLEAALQRIKELESIS